MANCTSFCWDIHYACNYRCPYCWFDGRWHELSRQNKYLPLDEVLKPWKDIYERYGPAHIELIGGEPFIYPRFAELIRELSQMHTIGITTNLSVDPGKFIKQVDPSKVKVTPTFHPLFADFDKFVRSSLLLKGNGMSYQVNYLAYPPHLKLLKYYMNKFNEYNLKLFIMTFWGKYNGTDYPQSYTQEEKRLIEPYLGNRQGEKFQLEPKQVKGKLCRAGQIYATIKADGLVFRCGGSCSELIGNLFSDTFKLLNAPSSCKSEFCPCNEWASLLVKEKDTARVELDETEPYRISSVGETKLSGAKKVIDRGSIQPQRVFITWDIHYACNYNCSYCNTPKPWNPPGSWDKDRDKVVYPGVDIWLKIWEEIYKKYGSCEIHITGGEPFTYPSFLELITGLSKLHTLEIITNLSFDINDIIDRITPDRVRIGTTFHPEFAELNEFLRKHRLLRERGFETWANYVAYPPQMEKMADYKKEFDKLKISFNIQPFMGHFQGRDYPKGYTDSELSYLKGCYANDDIINKKTVEWKTGSEQKNTKGIPCRMGQMYAKVYPLGDAYRCCANSVQKIGNLVDDTFELLNEALPCESDLCYCWRCMLVDKEEHWAQHWVVPEKKDYSLALTKSP
ncbi:MAG: radical SAM protein [bacterium]